MKRALTLGALALSMVLAQPSAAQAMAQADVNAALRANAPIYNGLFTAGLIKHIVDTCPDVQGPNRLMRVNYFMGLYNQARRLGFDRAQIEAFVEDEAEQERLRTLVKSHLAKQGVQPDDKMSVCTYARAQMTERTVLGARLRER
jgi:hypothetical protein